MQVGNTIYNAFMLYCTDWTDKYCLQTADVASSSPAAKRLKTGQHDAGTATQTSGMVI